MLVLEQMLNKYLTAPANILQQRGIYDFAVVCDTTNNTPARIDANEFTH